MTTAETIKLFRIKLKRKQRRWRLDQDVIDSCIHDAIIKFGEEESNKNHRLLWYTVQNVIVDYLRANGPINRSGVYKRNYMWIKSLEENAEDHAANDRIPLLEPQYPDDFDVRNSLQYGLEHHIKRLTPLEQKVIRDWYISERSSVDICADLGFASFGVLNYHRGKALMKLREMIERPNCNPDQFEAPSLKDIIKDAKEYKKRKHPGISDDRKEKIRENKRLSYRNRRKRFLAKLRTERPDLFRNGKRYWVRGVKRGKKTIQGNNNTELCPQAICQESVHVSGDAKIIT